MDSSKLATRLHQILQDRRGGAPPVDRPVSGGRLPSVEAAAAVLGASRWTIDGADCLVVEREYPAEQRHGAMAVGEYAEAAARAIGGLDLLGGETRDRLPDSSDPRDVLGRQLFFDLETTGLAGGAGTYAFLVGFGYFQGATFQTRQFFLADYADERYLLRAVSAFVEPLAGVVTFNGRAFDLPLIGTRYSMQRLRSPFEHLPHVDMLHPARRLWRRREASGDRPAWQDPARAGGVARASCALGALERAILDVERTGDVPGAEIPARFFDYIRHGDATPLVDVFEHNRLDLVSLAALTSIVLTMIEGGAGATRNPRECLALGRLFEQTAQAERAKACYARAARLADTPWRAAGDDDVARVEALRSLAVQLRRERRHDDAAILWQQVLEITVTPPDVQRQAIEALAIHHEHRSRDLDTALAYALRGVDGVCDDRFREGLSQRLARLRRKMAARPVGGRTPRFPP